MIDSEFKNGVAFVVVSSIFDDGGEKRIRVPNDALRARNHLPGTVIAAQKRKKIN
jgi:hypothetical protein